MIYNKCANISNLGFINIRESAQQPINKNYCVTESELQELLDYHHNEFILYESLLLETPNFRAFFENVKDFIVSTFKKFTKLIEKIISVFSINFVSNNDFSEKYKFPIKKGFEFIKDSGDEYTGVVYDSEAIDNFGLHISDMYINKQIRFIVDESKDSEYVYNNKEKYHYFRSNIVKNILDTDNDMGFDTVEEINNYVIDKICDKNNKINLVSYYKSGDDLCSILKNRNTDKNIKTEYKNVKSITNECLKSIDNAQKNLLNLNKKTHQYDVDSGKRIFSDLTNNIIFIQTVCQNVSATLAKYRYDELKQARSFAMACITTYEKYLKENQ